MHSNGRTFADSNEIASSFDHFLNVFSIMVSPISMKLSDVIQDKICKKKKNIYTSFFGRHFQSRDYKDFMFLLVRNFSQKVLKIGFLSNFQEWWSLQPQCLFIFVHPLSLPVVNRRERKPLMFNFLDFIYFSVNLS